MSVSTQVHAFYNTTPFPDYELERFNSRGDLVAAASSFSKILDCSIPADASIIDVGTGTGQLSAFLSLRRKCVCGIDFSDGSLNKARALKQKLGLNTWNLRKVDITDQRLIQDIGMTFDYLLCLGVLHHTASAYSSFKNIISLVKPGGYVAIGLYNAYGRIPHYVRVWLANTVFKNNDKVKDYFMRLQLGDTDDKEKLRGWWHDQYLHPYETCHTIGEVLTWFKKNDIEYYQTVPSLRIFDKTTDEVCGVWNNYLEREPSMGERFLHQLMWIYTTHHEGGYWITFGRKRR